MMIFINITSLMQQYINKFNLQTKALMQNTRKNYMFP